MSFSWICDLVKIEAGIAHLAGFIVMVRYSFDENRNGLLLIGN